MPAIDLIVNESQSFLYSEEQELRNRLNSLRSNQMPPTYNEPQQECSILELPDATEPNEDLTEEQQLLLDELIAMPTFSSLSAPFIASTSAQLVASSNTSPSVVINSSSAPVTSSSSTSPVTSNKIVRAVRNIGMQITSMLNEPDEDDSILEPGWMIRNQIDYEGLARSKRIREEFFDRESIEKEALDKFNAFITDELIEQEVRRIWSNDVKKSQRKQIRQADKKHAIQSLRSQHYPRFKEQVKIDQEEKFLAKYGINNYHTLYVN